MSRNLLRLVMLSLFGWAQASMAGSIIVVKEVATTPINSAIKFDFTSNELSPFRLGHLEYHTEIGLSAGVYTVSESPLANWSASDIFCQLSENPRSFVVIFRAAEGFIGAPTGFNNGDDSVRISLDANDTVMCFFTNVFRAPAAVCGNDIEEAGEECDDGNIASGDGCSATCQDEATGAVCGNDILEAGEECDDGNTASGDGCSSTCQDEATGAVCGNDILEAGEECDDGTANSDTTPNECRTDCTLPGCGDGVVDTGEQCDGGENCSSTCQFIVTPTGCSHNVAYWKKNTASWPTHTLILGSQNYNMQELADLLKSSEEGGDASVMLAQQLIALLLNIANGAVVTPQMIAAIATAQELLSGFDGKLPYKVNSHGSLGQEMLDARKELDKANLSNGPCRPVVTTADAGGLINAFSTELLQSDNAYLGIVQQGIHKTPATLGLGYEQKNALNPKLSNSGGSDAAIKSDATGCSAFGVNSFGNMATLVFLLFSLTTIRLIRGSSRLFRRKIFLG